MNWPQFLTGLGAVISSVAAYISHRKACAAAVHASNAAAAVTNAKSSS